MANWNELSIRGSARRLDYPEETTNAPVLQQSLQAYSRRGHRLYYEYLLRKMPRLVKFEIDLDNSLAVYYPGTVISGKLIITLNAPKQMRGVWLTFDGRAYTKWKKYSNKRRKKYEDEQIYFYELITLWGNSVESEDTPEREMPAGTHVFDFSYTIPANSPTSFEGDYGWIRYTVIGRIGREWQSDHITEKRFTVLGTYDLNTDPNADKSSSNEVEKELGCMCCLDGLVIGRLHLPKQGHAAGECVFARAEVINNSSQRIAEIGLTLVQHVTYHASRHGFTYTKFGSDVLVELIKEGPFRPRDSTLVRPSEGLLIPPVPLTLTMSGCKIIQINYVVKLDITPSGFSSGCSVSLPFLVGSVPLRREMAHLRETYRQFSIGQNADNTNEGQWPRYPSQPTPSTADVYPELPPPTYAEVIGGKVGMRTETDNDEDTREILEYVPRYAYYNWATPNLPRHPGSDEQR